MFLPLASPLCPALSFGGGGVYSKEKISSQGEEILFKVDLYFEEVWCIGNKQEVISIVFLLKTWQRICEVNPLPLKESDLINLIHIK